MVTAAMSFKREGDDAGQLGALQKRRVADLLASFIPEEEALLLRSGRYACTVCPHRPVFDTLAVLTVHRAGKKHQAGLQSFYVGKRPPEPAPQQLEEPAREVAAQGAAAPLLARTRRIAQSALLKAAPYSSRCRRTGDVPLGGTWWRRLELDAHPRVDGSGSRAATRAPSATPAAATAPPEPGISSLKDTEAVEATSAALLPGQRGRRAVTSKAAASRPRRGDKGKVSLSPTRPPEPLSAERSQALERYLQLRSAGWIQDSSGKWVKDENAEFDSDEDEPPA